MTEREQNLHNLLSELEQRGKECREAYAYRLSNELADTANEWLGRAAAYEYSARQLDNLLRGNA